MGGVCHNRLTPLHKRLFGGCHLNRYIRGLVAGAGFEIRDAESFYGEHAPRFLVAQTLGVAVSP